MTTPEIDTDAILKALRAGTGHTGNDGTLTPLIKQITEAALQAELEKHLDEDDGPNCKKRFEPQLVKNQIHLTDDLKCKVLALYALGNRVVFRILCHFFRLTKRNDHDHTRLRHGYRPQGAA